MVESDSEEHTKHAITQADDSTIPMDLDLKNAIEILKSPPLYAEYVKQLGTVSVSPFRANADLI